MAGLFVTGTDTDVGKTMIAAGALSVLRACGIDAVPMKPAQTGAARGSGGALRSPDVDFCLNAAGLRPDAETYSAMTPFLFEPACSPHLAAQQAGLKIDFLRIHEAFDALLAKHRFVVVEGAGGVMTPLTAEATMLDLMIELGLPVLLVARAGLGTLNHTLLSLAALRDAGLDIAGVVVNDARPGQWGAIENDNLAAISRLGCARQPAHVPFMPGIEKLANDPPAFHAAFSRFMPDAASLAARPGLQGAEDFRSMDAAAVWHPYTKRSAVDSGPLPMIVKGRGVFLEDASGRKYLDAISSWWACSLGHGHPRLLRALRGQSARLQHSILGNLSHPPAARLAERLSNMTGGNRHVLFASDGACAIEAAIKIAFQYRRNLGLAGPAKLVSHQDAYHGDTLGAMAAGFLDSFHAPFADLVAPAVRALPPDCHPCAWGCSPETCNLPCFEPMRRALEENAGKVAAVIVEPLCRGSAGMRMYSPAYLRRLADACKAHGALLIADEVAMGFGRTGRVFACDHAGIEPDIICVGKALSGGYMPISATIVKDCIYDTFRDGEPDRTFCHGHTFAGHPPAAAVALEALSIYEEERLAERSARLGAVLLQRLQQATQGCDVRSVRGLGLIGVVELGPNPEVGAARAQAARSLMLEEGVLLRPLGPVLYLMPPLVIAERDLLHAADALARAVRQAQHAG